MHTVEEPIDKLYAHKLFDYVNMFYVLDKNITVRVYKNLNVPTNKTPN